MRTDVEIEMAVAEHVMGWQWRQAPKWDYDGPLPDQGMVLCPPDALPDIDACVLCWPPKGIVPPTYFLNGSFRPLRREDHAMAILDHMQARGWAYDIGTYRHGEKRTQCNFFLRETERGYGEAFADGVDGAARRRAICLAALAACPHKRPK